MIIELIRYEVPAAQADAFVAAWRSASHELDASPHCLAWEVSRGHEEPQNFVVRIEWDSIAGHEEGFRRSPGFRSFFAAVRPYFDQIREMKHYERLLKGAGR